MSYAHDLRTFRIAKHLNLICFIRKSYWDSNQRYRVENTHVATKRFTEVFFKKIIWNIYVYNYLWILVDVYTKLEDNLSSFMSATSFLAVRVRKEMKKRAEVAENETSLPWKQILNFRWEGHKQAWDRLDAPKCEERKRGNIHEKENARDHLRLFSGSE